MLRKYGKAVARAMWCVVLSVCLPVLAASQAQPQAKPSPPASTSAPQAPVAGTISGSTDDAPPLAGDWAPELLYGIWNSPNSDASEALYGAAFAAGPDLIPQLDAALKDDRTAEFAAQSLAFIGGNRALEILSGLVRDPRDLGLKRFLYGALGEMDTPEATQALFDAIANADREPDRTITETAILALTVRSDAGVAARLRELETKAQDPVIRDDLQNAADVIAARAKYFASPEGASPDFSLERAVKTYFIPALETPSAPAPAKPAHAPGAKGAAAPPEPQAKVSVDHVVFSPDHGRALARVSFSVPGAIAHYDMVLAKQAGNWRLASVWLGSQEETQGQQ
ncbi:MAG TPA: HEAT repeat domain-containing protein [Terriglobia bacterium]|nr:HEAT repeat domain-containing protein [Terriglobia bacterium]